MPIFYFDVEISLLVDCFNLTSSIDYPDMSSILLFIHSDFLDISVVPWDNYSAINCCHLVFRDGMITILQILRSKISYFFFLMFRFFPMVHFFRHFDSESIFIFIRPWIKMAIWLSSYHSFWWIMNDSFSSRSSMLQSPFS